MRLKIGTEERWCEKWRVGGLEHEFYDFPYIWVNYNELTTSSLEIIVSKGNHPQMALIQVSELL